MNEAQILEAQSSLGVYEKTNSPRSHSGTGSTRAPDGLYGPKTSVSRIINLLIEDKKRYKNDGGYYPNLPV